jgi:ubiquinone/menaquinone biosynthesis C-methylase UbiE
MTESSTAALSFWQERYTRPLTDLGASGDANLQGIFSPGYDAATVGQYVQAQFLQEAERYVSRYANTSYWRALLERAFETAGLRPAEHPQSIILDLGSGAGNTILPLLELFPAAQILASDLSAMMLAFLRRALERANVANRCSLLQLNAEALDFRPASFDLVTGGAVLHHLLHPDQTLAGCARILKPGGYAIFFEPFENGNALLARVYAAILRQPGAKLLPDVANFFRHFVADISLRKGRDKSAPIFHKLDDKWCFTRCYVHEQAGRHGLSCTIYPLHTTVNPFEKQTEVYLRIGLGKDRAGLPDWAWELIRELDGSFSEDLKTDLLIEGCIILHKS